MFYFGFLVNISSSIGFFFFLVSKVGVDVFVNELVFLSLSGKNIEVVVEVVLFSKVVGDVKGCGGWGSIFVIDEGDIFGSFVIVCYILWGFGENDDVVVE